MWPTRRRPRIGRRRAACRLWWRPSTSRTAWTGESEGGGGGGAARGRPLAPPHPSHPVPSSAAVAAAAIFRLPLTSNEPDAVLFEPEGGVFDASTLPPYTAGALYFRESPLLLPLLARLQASHLPPSCVLVDGAGAAHAARCGAAVGLGAAAGLPTVGVAKSLLRVEGEVPSEREARAAGGEGVLEWRVGALVAALRSNDGVRPVYVSAGHRVPLEAASALVRACFRGHRAPEPARAADGAARKRLRELLDASGAAPGRH